ncbi:MAG: 2-C-methyl-D-erythritol 2,4-cyclodiphosphate synthase [Ignavibacteriales bacterium CG_4_9_14_3_um_filter_30_11]|nr:MAG: 2-C-methyl-D-erythritol 2,4-cyclodiphosphate synthase [Ignavibacteriales bacterium CG_4_9_14_3_um_filter_30_11]
MNDFRIGNGFDVHAFAENRKLILGGVEIPFEKGLIGHSDADVLLHAITDAVLGAVALGDIGKHFPDSDEKYKDADSMFLLKKAYELVREKKYQISNIDSILILERPKVASYILQMRENIATALNIELEQVSVKATTSEKLGFTGRGEGISSSAIILIKKEI